MENSMSMLVPRLDFEKTESPLGFAARLAAFHVGSRTRPFLCDIGVKPTDLVRGQPGAIQRLADRTGVAPEELGANAARGIDRRHFDLRGENVSSEFLATPYTVFCPACLLADDRASGGRVAFRHHHWTWQLCVARTCPDHGLPLLRRKADFSGDRFHELAIMVPETGDRLEDLIAPLASRTVSPLQTYALDRLDGKVGAPWLDGEGIEQAVRASELLGVLMVFGAKRDLNKLTADDWDRAGRVGYMATSEGEDGIRRALSKVQGSVEYKGSKPGPQYVFGGLYKWLARSRAKKDPGDIKRILREHIIETMDVPAGTVVLGEELAERRLHTCATLARETGLDPRTLWGVLAAKGIIPKDAPPGSHHVFDAERGRELARSMRRLIPLTRLPKRLGCTWPLVKQLISERILTPIVTEVSYAPGRTKKSVDSQDIATLLGRLQARSEPVENLPAGMVDLATAAMKLKAPAVEIVHLVLGGFLAKVARLDGLEGLAAIHVNPAETKSVVSEVMVGLSPAEAFGKIPMPVASGWSLVTEFPDRASLPMIKIRSASGDHTIHRVRAEDVEAFRAEFTTEARIANALGMGQRDLKPKMKSAGVKPVFRKADIGVRFFRRRDLPARFQV